MPEYLVAASDDTFRFDTAALVGHARRDWPEVAVTAALPGAGTRVDARLDLAPRTGRAPRLTLFSGGTAVGLDAHHQEDAAVALAWLCDVAHVPDDGSVLVFTWASDVVSARPGTTAADWMRAPRA